MAWRGTNSGLETFTSYTDHVKTHFREWALTTNLPPERWKAIFREYMRD